MKLKLKIGGDTVTRSYQNKSESDNTTTDEHENEANSNSTRGEKGTEQYKHKTNTNLVFFVKKFPYNTNIAQVACMFVYNRHKTRDTKLVQTLFFDS